MIILKKKTDCEFQVGDLISHIDYPDFQGRVVTIDNGKVKVMVIKGWLGKIVPTRPVPIPLGKVRRHCHSVQTERRKK